MLRAWIYYLVADHLFPQSVSSSSGIYMLPQQDTNDTLSRLNTALFEVAPRCGVAEYLRSNPVPDYSGCGSAILWLSHVPYLIVEQGIRMIMAGCISPFPAYVTNQLSRALTNEQNGRLATLINAKPLVCFICDLLTIDPNMSASAMLTTLINYDFDIGIRSVVAIRNHCLSQQSTNTPAVAGTSD